MFKKIDIFWSIYLAHRCFKFDVSIDDIIDVSKILRIPSSDARWHTVVSVSWYGLCSVLKKCPGTWPKRYSRV
jgi:hypothetical protein